MGRKSWNWGRGGGGLRWKSIKRLGNQFRKSRKNRSLIRKFRKSWDSIGQQ